MITSAQNTRIKTVRALLTQHLERTQNRKYVVEGVRLVEEAITAQVRPDLVLFSGLLSERGQSALEKLKSLNCEIEEVTPALLKSLSDTDTPQGILAVVPMQTMTLPEKADFIVLADQIRDPGNMGTLLRTCLAAEVQAVIYTVGTVDVYSPKVVRSAMGAHFRLPIISADWNAIRDWLAKQKTTPPNLWISDVREGIACWEADLKTPMLLGIGNEAEGMSAEAYTLPHRKIHIPMPGQAESLNASVAAGILIFEAIRQRSIPS